MDATEGGLHPSNSVLDILWSFRAHTDRISIDTPQLLEQQALSLHHGKSSLRPNVSKPKDPSTVGNYRDTVPLVGIVIDAIWIFLNFLARVRNAGRIPTLEIITGIDRS